MNLVLGRKPFSMTSSCGTFPYAAPEVSSKNEPVYNEKVDIYSLGNYTHNNSLYKAF